MNKDEHLLLMHEFFHAMFLGNNRMIISLLYQGVDINALEEGVSLLAHACSFPSITVGVCKLFIQKGANVNHVDKKGNSILHYTDEIDKLKLLIKHNINLNVVNLENETALEIKIKNNKFEAAQYLIDCGANYNLVRWDKMSKKACDTLLFPIIAKNEKESLEKNIMASNSALKIKI
jgi:ankyrin repeat protein